MKKLVLKMDLYDDKITRKAMKTVCSIPGVESVSVERNDQKVIIGGDCDPVLVVQKLRKFSHTEIVSIGPAKEEMEPAKEKKKEEEPAKEEKKEKEPAKKGKEEEPAKEEKEKEPAKKGKEEELAKEEKKEEEPAKEEKKEEEPKRVSSACS